MTTLRLLSENDDPEHVSSQASDVDVHGARDWPFSVTMHFSPDAPGPVFVLEGKFCGLQAFGFVRRALEFASTMAGEGRTIGIDLTRATLDETIVGHIALTGMYRLGQGGSCRYLIPKGGWEQTFLRLLPHSQTKVTKDGATQTIAVDLGVGSTT